MKRLRRLLLPFAYLYGIVVEGIKFSYRLGWQKSTHFQVPTVVLGNLSTGGTGKTPHTEYILKRLRQQYNIVVLSRGYGRKTKGFRWVEPSDAATAAGDEPLQIKKGFPNVPVVVCEKRTLAIPKILAQLPETNLILLDDGMQHWPLTADCYIMFSPFSDPFFNDYILPAGNLREFRFNYTRAHIIVLSKCPPEITEAQRQDILGRLKPAAHQKVYFSYLKYGLPYQISDYEKKLAWEALADLNIFLIVGIATPAALVEQLKKYSTNIELYQVSDHHYYNDKDLAAMLARFSKLQTNQGPSIMLSTAKDAVRLKPLLPISAASTLYIVPIEVEFAFREGDAFLQQLLALSIENKKKRHL